MPNVINAMIVRELTAEFHGAEAIVFVSAEGLTVKETESLRADLDERGARLRMVRNRLARLALCERGLEPPAELFRGNVAAVAGGIEAVLAAAKVFHGSDLSKKAGKIAFKGALLEGRLLGPADATALADLPGKDELRAMLLGALSGPARMLVSVLAAPGGALARVVQARVDAAGESGEAPAAAS